MKIGININNYIFNQNYLYFQKFKKYLKWLIFYYFKFQQINLQVESEVNENQNKGRKKDEKWIKLNK